ncbi:MAG: DUF4390 domain-containing protein [Polynucleobacter sp.]|nr:DUF4390 domain-containing protein [Polynucleobacter sp.]
MSYFFRKLLCALCLVGGGFLASAALAEGIQIKRAELERVEKEWFLNAAFQIELSPSLEEAVKRGVTLHFLTEFDLTRGRWYWFDEKPAQVERPIRLTYQPLTRLYRISSEGFAFSSNELSEALQAVGSIGGWRIIEASELDPGKTYLASIRMILDLSKLPKPFQVNALNSKEWNLASPWLRFSFNPNSSSVLGK